MKPLSASMTDQTQVPIISSEASSKNKKRGRDDDKNNQRGVDVSPLLKRCNRGKVFFSFLNKQNVNMYSNCKNVNIYYKKRWPMLLKWGLFSRLPELIVFRAIKTGICSPGWRQNNSNKTKWPMPSRLNNVLCVRQHMDFGNEFESCFPRFDKMVGKVSKLKTKFKLKTVFQGLTRWLARSQTPRPLQTPCGRVTT